jgi:hypothetical protein
MRVGRRMPKRPPRTKTRRAHNPPLPNRQQSVELDSDRSSTRSQHRRLNREQHHGVPHIHHPLTTVGRSAPPVSATPWEYRAQPPGQKAAPGQELHLPWVPSRDGEPWAMTACLTCPHGSPGRDAPDSAGHMAGVTGLEPATGGFGSRCSLQLSYTPRRSVRGTLGAPVTFTAPFRVTRTPRGPVGCLPDRFGDPSGSPAHLGNLGRPGADAPLPPSTYIVPG